MERIHVVKDFLHRQGRMSYKWLDHKEIGRRVAEIRDGLELSQRELAEKIGRPKSQGDIAKIEKGTLWAEGAEPNARLLLDVAELGGVTIQHFQAGGSARSERDEKLIAAKWMTRMAERLRQEALATPQPAGATLPVEGEHATRTQGLESAAGGKRGRKRVPKKA